MVEKLDNIPAKKQNKEIRTLIRITNKLETTIDETQCALKDVKHETISGDGVTKDPHKIHISERGFFE